MATHWMIATNNPHKLVDLQKDLQFYGFDAEPYTKYFDEIEFPQESKISYKDNSIRKAKFLSDKILRPVISDDSGVEIPELSKQLGVTTKRDLHKLKGTSDNLRLLELLKDVPTENRAATMITFLTAITENGDLITAAGKVTGRITTEEVEGYSGGFDKVFYVPEVGKTLSQMPDEERIPYTHRGRAAENLMNLLKREGQE